MTDRQYPQRRPESPRRRIEETARIKYEGSHVRGDRDCDQGQECILLPSGEMLESISKAAHQGFVKSVTDPSHLSPLSSLAVPTGSPARVEGNSKHERMSKTIKQAISERHSSWSVMQIQAARTTVVHLRGRRDDRKPGVQMYTGPAKATSKSQCASSASSPPQDSGKRNDGGLAGLQTCEMMRLKGLGTGGA